MEVGGRDLESFMERIGAKLHDAAAGTGLHFSTISRIRSGVIQNPKRDALEKIADWADREANRLNLPTRDRLNWLRPAPAKGRKRARRTGGTARRKRKQAV